MRFTDEQLLALAPERHHRIVSAQAGAGKTGVLVERILRQIVDEKISLDHMLIVTFTKKAAGEMRDRIRAGLGERLKESNQSRTYLLHQMNLVASAHIQTMHAFCFDVIRQHFDLLDRDPGIRILTQRQLDLLFAEAVDEVLDLAYADGGLSEAARHEFSLATPDHVLAFLRIFADPNHRDDQGIRQMIHQWIQRERSSIEGPSWSRRMADQMISSDEQSRLRALGAKWLLREPMQHIMDQYDTWERRWGAVLPEVLLQFIAEERLALGHLFFSSSDHSDLLNPSDALENGDETREEWEADLKRWQSTGLRFAFGRLPLLSKKKYSDEMIAAKDQIRDARTRIKKEFVLLQQRLSLMEDHVLEEESQNDVVNVHVLAALSRDVQTRMEQKKAEQNGLDFEDMETLMLQLLQHSEVRGELQELFSCIFFDEYQDANAKQEAIIEAIARKDNLFFVGDMKQSIYGFRGAAPEIFLQRYDLYQKSASGEAIDLTRNFRSEPEVLDFVNRIFSGLMTPERGGVSYDTPAHRAVAGRAAEGKGSAQVVLLEEPEALNEHPEESVWNRFSSEPFYVAAAIRSHVEAGGQFRDCAVLARTNQALADYQRVMEHWGIPCVLDGNRDAEEALERQIALNLLKALDNGQSDVPLLTLMLSFIGGFSEEDLAKLRIAHPEGAFFEAFSAALERKTEENAWKEETPSSPLSEEEDATRLLDHQLLGRMEALSRWMQEQRLRLRELPLSEWMSAFFEESGLRAFLTGLPNGTQRRRNLDVLCRMAEEFEKSGDGSLTDFLSYAEAKAGNGADVLPSSPLSEQDNVVRLMTIHQSKGLQFPIVFLVGTGRKIQVSGAQSTLSFAPEIGPVLDSRRLAEDGVVERLPSLRKVLCRQAVDRRDRAEEVRVLYVAMTRAMTRLVIVGHADDLKKLKPESTGSLSSDLDQDVSVLQWILHVLGKNDAFDREVGGTLRARWADEDGNEAEAGDPALVMLEPGEKFRSIAGHASSHHAQEHLSDGEISRVLGWSDPHFEATVHPLKLTVSQLSKKNQILDDHFIVWPPLSPKNKKKNTPPSDDFPLPLFLREQYPPDAATSGTLMHRALQNLPLHPYSQSEMEEELDRLMQRGLFTMKERQALNEEKLVRFFESEAGQFIVQHAEAVQRERSFTMKLQTQQGMVAVDGQIDLFVRLEGEILLLDFKTDRVPDASRYQLQLKLYAEALQRAFPGSAVRAYLYWVSAGETERIML